MKLQARNFVVRKPETIDITMFFKKFCIATRTISSIHKGFDFMNTRFFCIHCLETLYDAIFVFLKSAKQFCGFRYKNAKFLELNYTITIFDKTKMYVFWQNMLIKAAYQYIMIYNSKSMLFY